MTVPATLSDHQRLVILQEYALQVYGRWSYPGMPPDTRDLSLTEGRASAGTSLQNLTLVAEMAVFLGENYRSTSFATVTDQVISDLVRVIVGDSLQSRTGSYWVGGAKGSSGFNEAFVDSQNPRDDQGAHAMAGLLLGHENRYLLENTLWLSEYLGGQPEDARLYGASYSLGSMLTNGNIHFLPELINRELGDGSPPLSAFHGFSDSEGGAAEQLVAANSILEALISSSRWRFTNQVPNASAPAHIFGPCFSAPTPILLADGRSTTIESIRVGDRVAAFDEADSAGTGPLRSGLVTRLIPGITTEWIVLDDGTRVTPGHRYLRPDGSFMAIGDIIAGDGLVVDAGGNVTRVTGTLLSATDSGSDATLIEPEPIAMGGLLVRQAPVLGWPTYNFTVDGLHTYVAAGKRVHNDCLNPGEQLLPETFQLTDNGYSIDVIDPVTGLVTTINHEVVGSAATNGGWETVVLTRSTYLADIDSYLSAEWDSFDSIGQPLGAAGYSIDFGGWTHALGPIPDGFVVQPRWVSVASQPTQFYVFADPTTGQIVQGVSVTSGPTPAESFVVTASWDQTDPDNMTFTADMWNAVGGQVGTVRGLSDGTQVSQQGTANDPASWQTTVTTPRHGLTPAQQQALMEQAALNQIDFNLQNYELAGGEIGQIFGSSLGQALAGDNVFAQVASSTVLGTLLRNIGETWGRSVTTGESLLDAAIGENGAFNDFDAELGQNFQQQALGAVSGFLLGELAEVLEFDSAAFGDQLRPAAANDNAPWTDLRLAALGAA